MADHHDAQDYKANGPTDIAFRTGGDDTGIARGVVAHGTVVGVTGIGTGTPGAFVDVLGVYGEGRGGVGVYGRSIGGHDGEVRSLEGEILRSEPHRSWRA